mmetsp:Transcript_18879/g.21631  ORF Transcript_18879/g.21631 Transcript_18879/m.21631 type:complete len:478 (-) Transcript_18879:137-1570(-)|eukprot:CAMPEP_0194171832 /NCGR_PEP_ID=MMETSP0154-20130528/6393_1 /TAXON_ID=1049557 /ORGANISM="Thalassiothrix antarctica, Strain L6-D1" /LENGTH=477 /DNA_ID=CAMNT_0038884303 /DNA_START=92 /DNA_END=1525 /DNA_ORIENTATION=+
MNKNQKIETIGSGEDEKLRRELLEGTTRDAQERICTVDERNAPTANGHLRSEMRLKNMWHRATYVIVRHMEEATDEKGEEFLLVQLRTKLKDYCPNKLDPAPGGVVGFGESYLENAQREIEEEMGILTHLQTKECSETTDTKKKNSHLIQRFFTFSFQDNRVRCWGDLYEVQYTGPLSCIKIQKEEVEEIQRLSLSQIKSKMLQQPEEWTPDGLHALRLYLQFRHDTKINRRLLKGYSGSNLNVMTLRPRPKVIFFDCDDCLYFDNWKTADQISQKIEEWCTQKKGLPPKYAYELYKKYGTALKGLLAENYIDNNPEDIEQYLREVHDLPIHTLLKPDPKLRLILERLDPSIPKFIFTASVRHHAERCLKALGIDNFFSSENIIDVKSCNLETKHCCGSFQIAMEIANVTAYPPESCLFFDDSTKNIQMGRKMGWRSVLVGKVGRDCKKNVSCDDTELEMNSIHDLEKCFPELFIDR